MHAPRFACVQTVCSMHVCDAVSCRVVLLFCRHAAETNTRVQHVARRISPS